MKQSQLIHSLATIAIRTHGHNPSPVQTIQDLAALPLEDLQKLQVDATQWIETDNTEPNDKP